MVDNHFCKYQHNSKHSPTSNVNERFSKFEFIYNVSSVVVKWSNFNFFPFVFSVILINSFALFL
jgi:hypothetical protein